jgi:hypothetical protein
VKLTIIGCTLLLCGVVLYGFRYVAAAILSLQSQGIPLTDALAGLGRTPALLMLAFFVLGLVCLGIRVWQIV